jgi:hypothetical protein
MPLGVRQGAREGEKGASALFEAIGKGIGTLTHCFTSP